MRILLTNDDGLYAPGLQTLAKRLQAEHQVFIVAPAAECSNCGHGVSVRRPLKCVEVEAGSWLIDGFPADCIRTAKYHLHLEVDVVISGINLGGNLGIDIPTSGTCAGAREASISGWKAIAISQVRKPGVTLDWYATTSRAIAAWQQVMDFSIERPGFWNINLPAIAADAPPPTLEIVPPELGGMPVDFEATDQGLLYRSNYQARPRMAGSDVERCFGGSITASFIALV